MKKVKIWIIRTSIGTNKPLFLTQISSSLPLFYSLVTKMKFLKLSWIIMLCSLNFVLSFISYFLAPMFSSFCPPIYLIYFLAPIAIFHVEHYRMHFKGLKLCGSCVGECYLVPNLCDPDPGHIDWDLDHSNQNNPNHKNKQNMGFRSATRTETKE